MLAPLTAQAATFTVNAWDDGDSDGSCDPLSLSPTDDCTVRDAVDEANANSGADTIVINSQLGKSGSTATTARAAEVTNSCAGVFEDDNACGDLDVWDANSGTTLTIEGNGVGNPSITGNPFGGERVLHAVATGGSKQAVHLVLEDISMNGGGQGLGGSRTVGGGCIATESTDVTMTAAQLSGCEFTSGSGYSAGAPGGGALYVGGDLTMTDSRIQQSRANSSDGGAVHAKGDVTLTDSGIVGNAIQYDGAGGGLYNDTATATVTISGTALGAISGNEAIDDGGGLWLDVASVDLSEGLIAFNDAGGDGAGAHLTADDVTLDLMRVEGNIADGDGGGLWLDTPELRIEDSEITANEAGSLGGGVYLVGFDPAGSTDPEFERSAFLFNEAVLDGAGALISGVSTSSTNPIRFFNVTFGDNDLTSGTGTGAGLTLDSGPGTLEIELKHTTFLYNNDFAGTIAPVKNDGNNVETWNSAYHGDCVGTSLVSNSGNVEDSIGACVVPSGDFTSSSGDVKDEFNSALSFGPAGAPARGYSPVDRSLGGDADDYAPPGVLPVDQHGVARSGSLRVDIGALED